MISRCLHHKSLDSQLVYTKKAEQEVSDALNKATQQLTNPQFKVEALNWEKLTEYGFSDIDPYGYFTGKNPKFRGK